MKTMLRPSRRAFFYMRPPSPTPALNSFLIAFSGSLLGFLATPVQPAQDSPNMTGVVGDAIRLLDHLRDASQRPQFGIVSSGQRTALKQSDDLRLLRGRQFRRPSRGRARAQSPQTFRLVGPRPTVNRTHRSTQGLRDRGQVLTCLEQLDSTAPACLQLLRSSTRSHVAHDSRSYPRFPLFQQTSIVRKEAP